MINDLYTDNSCPTGYTGRKDGCMINPNFRKKLLDERCVETRKYRYIIAQEGEHVVIERLPLELIGTAKAFYSWEIVEILG